VLVSERVDVSDDPLALYEQSLAEGWGDGLPLIPPTEARVRMMLSSTAYHADDVIGILPPAGAPATVELAAINAVMAGCRPDGFPLLIAALEAATQRELNLFGLVTTTSSVCPMLIVNGPRRDELGIDYGPGCMGGAAGRGSSTIGRAVMLCLRNIGGQKVGVTSKSVFGQPARTAGLCFGEWEERSPWPSLARRRGYGADEMVVTVHGGKGTFPLADINTVDARDLLYLIAKSVAFPMGNKFLTPSAGVGQTVVVLNPLWADRIAAVFPDADDVGVFLQGHAWQAITSWPEANRPVLESKGRVDANGRVHMSERPDQFVVVVCGGLGNLHAICLPSWGDSEIQSATAYWATPALPTG
jgi:hypothetical protein